MRLPAHYAHGSRPFWFPDWLRTG